MKLKDLLNETPIPRSKVDYGTMNLKSNIDQKWVSVDIMLEDLTQWIQGVEGASGPLLRKEIGTALKEMGIEILTGRDVSPQLKTKRSPEADADRLRQAIKGKDLGAKEDETKKNT